MNDNNKHPVMYFSYLLRLWRTSEDNQWKASLEDPRTGQRIGFQSLDVLVIYLREQTQTIVLASHGAPDEPHQTSGDIS